jgi:hypothetical protein
MSLRNELGVDQDVEQTGSTSLDEDAFAEQSALLDAQGECHISRSNSFGVPGSVSMAEYEKRKSVAGIISLLLIWQFFPCLRCRTHLSLCVYE